MAFTVTILGSNSAGPISERNSSAQVLDNGRQLFLLDCAEGTQVQMRRYKIRMMKIDHIFITHLHGDHFFGLIGLLTTYHLLGRKKTLNIYAVSELERVVDVLLAASDTTLQYPVVYHSLHPDKKEVIYEDPYLTVTALPLLHRIPTCGFLFREKAGPRRISKTALAGKEIPVMSMSLLKQGQDIRTLDGELLRNRDITLDPHATVSYAYCTDTGYHEPLAKAVEGVTILFHEATFMEKELPLAREKQHSTAADAARIAQRAGVKRLLLGHFSSRYRDLTPLLEEARKVFPATELALDGQQFLIDNNV